MRALFAIAALAACGYGADGVPGDDGSPDSPTGFNDAPVGCNVAIGVFPNHPIAAPTAVVRLDAAVVNAPGVQSFTWTVRRGGTIIPTQPAQPDNSAVTFDGSVAGTYQAFLDVEVPQGLFCPQGSAMFDITAPGAGQALFRFHVVPPRSAGLAPDDQSVLVTGGPTDTISDFIVPPSGVVDGFVRANGQPTAAYLKFIPRLARDAPVEAFADGTGGYTATLRSEVHDVLVVPVAQTFAPRNLVWMPGTTELDVDAGMAISGTLRDNANAPLAGANVQLAIDGVPTTFAVTDAAGAFTVRGLPHTGATVAVDVDPPASSGLPRIHVVSAAIDATAAIAIKYNATTIRDLAGTSVKRGGVAVANADVALVVALANVATVGGVTAGGELHASATANAAGVLPTLRAPAQAVSAVITAGTNDMALAAVDLTTGVPATINALAMAPVTTKTRAPDSTLIGGVTMDAFPLGPLALAGAPTIHAVSNSTGTIATSFIDGGSYELRFLDPAPNRGALLIIPSITAATIAAGHTLKPPTQIFSTVKTVGPVARASVQVLCAQGAACVGLERGRPIAEAVTGVDGSFTLSVPDPTK